MRKESRLDTPHIAVNWMKEYTAAWNAGETEAVVSLYAADAVLLSPNRPAAIGQVAIRNALLKSELRDLTFKPCYVERSGQLVYSFGYYTGVLVQAKGTKTRRNGKYLLVLRRGVDGRWRAVADACFPDQSDAGVASDEPLSRKGTSQQPADRLARQRCRRPVRP